MRIKCIPQVPSTSPAKTKPTPTSHMAVRDSLAKGRGHNLGHGAWVLSVLNTFGQVWHSGGIFRGLGSRRLNLK